MGFLKALADRLFSHRMRRDWDERARENAFYYVATGGKDWEEEAFYESGRTSVQHYVLEDLQNICQGEPPGEMKVLEIGCGVGRITRALSELFGEVHAVDVSGEMVVRARVALASCPNAFVYQNNGSDLRMFADETFDFAFSTLVFQHIPSRRVIENYVREVYRVLKPGRLFKFQVQGGSEFHPPETFRLRHLFPWYRDPECTWLGAPYLEEEAEDLARTCGFELRYQHGAGTQEYWLWLFRKS